MRLRTSFSGPSVVLTLAAVTVALTACGGGSSADPPAVHPTATHSTPPVATPTPSTAPTPAKTPTPTPAPSSTPMPTATPTVAPYPTPTPCPSGEKCVQLFPNPLVTNPNVLTDVEMEGGPNFFFEVVSENCDSQGIAHVGFPQYSSLPVTGLAAYGSCSVTIIDQGDPSYQPAVLSVINTPAAGR